MKKQPQRLKLSPETPSAKTVKVIPLPALNPNLYDIEVARDDDGLFSLKELKTDNENYSQDNPKGIR